MSKSFLEGSRGYRRLGNMVQRYMLSARLLTCQRFLLFGIRYGFTYKSTRHFSTSQKIRKQYHIEESTTSRPKFELRDYQQRCIKECIQALERNQRRIGVSLPTGGGKTVVFSNLIDHVKPKNGHGDKVMILAHRKELIFQAAATCKSVHPDKTVDVEMADYHATEDADIVIASVQTLMRGRLEKFDPMEFKLVIVDEAHHAAADSYIHTFKHFGITEPDSDVALVGFSATLQRDDSKHLASVIDEVVFHMDTEEMVTNKHLCDAKFSTVRMMNADLSGVATRAGEFVIPKLAAAVNKPENNELVLRTYLHFVTAHNVKSALLFGVDIKHVTDLSVLFKERGVNSDFVTSLTKPDVRKDRIAKFKAGEISVLMNCGIFTEGTDIPNIDCVLLVRPTRSKNLLIQMIGRGLRLHHSKEFCHIVDFVGVNNSAVISVPCLQGLPNDDEINGLSLEEMEERKIYLEERRVKKEEKKRLEQQKKEEELGRALDLELRNGVIAGVPNLEYDEEAFDFQNIELKTFETFHDFIEMGEMEKEDDLYYIRSSRYPWTRVGNNTWITPYPSLKPHINIHLRLQRHKRGITKHFLNEVSIKSIYKNRKVLEQHMNQSLTIYTLASYTDNPEYDRFSNRYSRKYKVLLLLPLSKDIRTVLSYVDKVFKDRFRGRDLTKYAPWRNEAPTDKQQKYIYTLINRSFPKQMIRKNRLAIINEIPNMKRGEASDFLLAQANFGDKPIQLFIEMLRKRAEREDKAEPGRVYKNLKSFFEMVKSKEGDLDNSKKPVLRRVYPGSPRTSQPLKNNENVITRDTASFFEPPAN